MKILNYPVIEPDSAGFLPVPYMINNIPHVVMKPKMVQTLLTLCSESKTIVMLTREPFYDIKEIEHRVENNGETKEYFADLIEAYKLKPLISQKIYVSIDGYHKGTSKDDVKTIGFQPVIGYEPNLNE